MLRTSYIRRWLALVVLALLLAGCGLSPAPTPTPAPVTLRYVTFPGFNSAEETLFAQYHADHPQVKIAVEEYSQPPDAYVTMTSGVPDLMLITPGLFLDGAIASGQLADLTNLWQESGAQTTLLPSLAALSRRDGKQYYLPIGFSWTGFYYDKAVFAQYGLQPPQTWDEFLQVCETLLTHQVVPLSISGADPFMGSLWLDYLDLRLNGPEVHRQWIAGEIPFTDPRIRTVFETWAGLVEQGYFVEGAERFGIQEALAAVVQHGELLGSRPAMVLSGPAFLGQISAERRAELGFFPFPVMDSSQPRAEVVMAIGYMAPNTGPNRDQALDLLGYLASAQGRSLLAQSLVASGLYAPAFALPGDGELPASVRQGTDLAAQAETVTTPCYMSVPVTLWPALAAMQQRLLTGPGSPAGFDLDAVLAKLEAARKSGG